jgi:hypothetical protein
MVKPDSILKVSASSEDLFFTKWLLFLKPFHKMTDRQISVAAQFLKQRHELSQIISDDKILEENVMSDTTKKKVRDACGVSQPFFISLLADLRVHNFIVDGKINPKYIPKLNGSSKKGYTLLLYFDFTEDDTRKE